MKPRRKQSGQIAIDHFRAQHLALAEQTAETPSGRIVVVIDESESPLAWLARRKGRNGQALISPVQLLAGERLRAEFTRAQMMPRTTANWTAPVAGSAGASIGGFTESAVAARQRLRAALDNVGPEFTGLLLDVCCFLKRLEDVEGERGWPPRSAKVVLRLGLDRLARHYGLAAEARANQRAEIRSWAGEELD
jgi:hypothetical protein